jgi:hypothetical protein
VKPLLALLLFCTNASFEMHVSRSAVGININMFLVCGLLFDVAV